MRRLTTDCARDSFEVSMNYVFGKDGWAHIVSDGEHENVPLTSWARAQCIKRGCDEFPGETPEEIDQTLCDCIADGDGCPIALAYCFASQACHLRTRLKQYEDTGLTPDEIMGLCSMDKRAKMAELLRMEENRPLNLDQLKVMDGEPVWCARWGVWGLVDIGSAAVITRKGDLDINDEGIHDRLYRRKPEAGEPPC